MKLGINRLWPSLFIIAAFILLSAVSSFADTATYHYDDANRFVREEYGQYIAAFTITATAGVNGTITPSGAISVARNTDKTFVIAANTGYQIKDVLVDGVSAGVVTSYTFMNVRANHSISATFELKRPIIEVSPTAIVFGSIKAGTTSGVETFTVSNTGSLDLVIGTIALTGANPSEFAKGPDTCTGRTITQGSSSCTVSVAFTPGSAGPKSATLAIPSNDPVTPTSSALLSGTGVNPVLTVSKGGMGTGRVTSTPAGIDCGNTCTASFDRDSLVTLTATPDPNMAFTGWSGCPEVDPQTGACKVNLNTDTSVTATFIRRFTLTVIKSGTGIGAFTGTGMVTGTDSGVAVINCGADCAETVNEGTVITLSAVADPNSDFRGWAGCTPHQQDPTQCTVTMNSNISATSSFAIKTFTITEIPGGGGQIAPTTISDGAWITTPNAAIVTYGASPAFAVIPDQAATLIEVRGDGVSVGPLTSYTFSHVTADHTIAAVFACPNMPVMNMSTGLPYGTLQGAYSAASSGDIIRTRGETLIESVNFNRSGISVTVDGGYGCSFADGSNSGRVTLIKGQVATVLATSTLRNIETMGQFTNGTSPLTVSVIDAAGGRVTSTLSGISTADIKCGNGDSDCSEVYANGVSVALTATARDGYAFTGWAGDCSGTASTCTVTMGQARNVTANFTIQGCLLNVTRNDAAGGAVTSTNPASPVVDCGTNCSVVYDCWAEVTLVATSDQAYNFTGWSGSGINCPGTGTCTVTMDTSPKNLTASFAIKKYTITANASGNGSGTVTSNAGGINYAYPPTASGTSALLNYGTSVVLTATANTGSTVVWTGCDATGGNSTTASCSINNITGNKTAVAIFTLNSYTLSVTVSDASNGTVTSIPVGVNCGADCSEGYNHGTEVTLSVEPVAPYITEWSGACTGNGSTCSVIMDGPKSVTAGFCAPVMLNNTAYATLLDAYNNASSNAVIRAYGPQTLIGGLTIDNVNVTAINLQGGYDCTYTTYSGTSTEVKGKIQTVKGITTMKNFNVVP